MRRALTVIALLGVLATACTRAETVESTTSAPPTTTTAAPRETIATAPDRVFEAGSARLAVEITRAGEESRLVAGSGEVDFRNRRAHLLFDLAPTSGVGGEIPGGIETIIDGSTIYQRLAFAESALPEGVSWIAISPGDAAGADDPLPEAAAADPAALLDSLRGVRGDVETVGEHFVRGVATTHYRFELELAEVFDDSESGPLDDLAETTIPVDLWLDGEGLVRRMRQEVPVPGLDEEWQLVVTLELYDYGAPVAVAIPDPSEVIGLLDLLETTS